MTDETPVERARMFAEEALRNYETYGNVAPLVALCSDNRVVMAIAYGETQDQADQFGRIIRCLVGRFEPHTIVTVAEGWKREMSHHSEAEAMRIVRETRHGDLERAAEAGDPDIRTALMTTAWRHNHTETHSVIDTVVREREVHYGEFVRQTEWKRTEFTGHQHGHMNDVIVASWKIGLDNAPDPDIPDEALFAFLGIKQLATNVTVQEWDDDAAAD